VRTTARWSIAGCVLTLALVAKAARAQIAGYDVPPPPVATLEPGPGRAPVDLESVGRPQIVGNQTYWIGFREGIFGTRRPHIERGIARLCRTPCRIWAPPGELTLQFGGRGSFWHRVGITVPLNGARVTLERPSVLLRAMTFATLAFGATTLAVAAITAALDLTPHGMTFNPLIGMTTVTVAGPNPGPFFATSLLVVGASSLVTSFFLGIGNQGGVRSIQSLTPSTQ